MRDLEAISRKREGTRVFISHGKESPALAKIERLVRGLGLEPVLGKDQPSLGRSVDDLVTNWMKSCEVVVVLATKDEDVGWHYWPRPNARRLGRQRAEIRSRMGAR